MPTVFTILLSNAERQWLVENISPDYNIRTFFVGLYLEWRERDDLVAFNASLDDLFLLDVWLFDDNPFKTKLSDGQLLSTFAIKVWQHLVSLEASTPWKGVVTYAAETADTDRQPNEVGASTILRPGND